MLSLKTEFQTFSLKPSLSIFPISDWITPLRAMLQIAIIFNRLNILKFCFLIKFQRTNSRNSLRILSSLYFLHNFYNFMKLSYLQCYDKLLLGSERVGAVIFKKMISEITYTFSEIRVLTATRNFHVLSIGQNI